MVFSFKLGSSNYLSITNDRNPYSANMIVIGLLLMTTLLQMDSVGADSRHGPGYVGCYLSGNAWQDKLQSDTLVNSTDHCVNHCRSYKYAAISVRTCFCTNILAEVLNSSDDYCNVTCTSNPCQICGSSTHYSVYNSTERLISPGFNATLNCLTCCRLNESAYVPSTLESTTKPEQKCSACVITRENDSNANKECAKELVDECCACRQLWLRIIIDVAVIFGILFLIILVFLVVRFCRNRRRGMFDDWQPRSSGQTRQVESSLSRSDDDLLHRNHSYRNLSGSSTLDRDLESVEQASAAMAASGDTAMARSLSDDSGNRYGSLPAPAKGASARNPRAVNISMKKPNTGMSPAKVSTKGNSSEGEYYEPDSFHAPDQPGNQPAPPDSKSNPKHNSKTGQRDPAKDTAVVEDAVLDKSKRRSLFNIMSKGSRMPSSPGPSKGEDVFPKDPVPIMDRHRGSRYGKKNIKKSEAAERRTNCSVSKDEQVFQDPKSNTLPNDIYALPNKPACRNKQPKKMSDTTKGAKPGNVELHEGYSRLSRLFKPRAIEKGKSKRGDDTTSPEEYSVLHPGSKDPDYDKPCPREATDGPFAVEEAKSACKPDEGMYASVDGTPAASQSGDYEIVTHVR